MLGEPHQFLIRDEARIAIQTSMTSTTPTNDSLVSWQSAFWALVPIVLNSMTQPAGSLFGYHAYEQGFVLRSSPIICACDSLHFLFCLARQLVRTRSPRDAMRTAVAGRFQHADEQNSAAQLQRNVVFRVALFALGALPQIVKILSMRGIPWTTALASMFLVSFLVLEVGVYYNRVFVRNQDAFPDEVSTTSPATDAERRVGLGIIFVNSAVCYYHLAVAAYEIMLTIGSRTWPYATGLCILALTPVLDKLWLKQEEISLLQGLMLFPDLFGVVLSCCLLLSVTEMARSADSNTSLALCVAGGIIVVLVILTNLLYWQMVLAVVETQPKQVDFIMGTLLLVMNLTTALLYYAFKYSPEGTYKPLWVNQLG